MKKTVDFTGRTQLLIEDGRARVLLSGSTLSQTVRLSTGLDNTSGQELAREIATQQLKYAYANTTAPSYFDISPDGSVLLKDLGFEVTLELDHNGALVVGAARFLKESSLMRAVRIIRIAVRALGWKPTGVVAPTDLHRMLSLALHPKVHIDEVNGVPLEHLRISGITQLPVYSPSITGFVLASKDLDEIRTATAVLGEVFTGAEVNLVVVGARFDDVHTRLMDKSVTGSVSLTVVDKLHAETVHVSISNDLMLEVRLRELASSPDLKFNIDAILVRSRSGKKIDGPLKALPKAMGDVLRAASEALIRPAGYFDHETVVECVGQVSTEIAPKTTTVLARTLVTGDVIVADYTSGEQEVQQVRAYTTTPNYDIVLEIELVDGVIQLDFEETLQLVRRAGDIVQTQDETDVLDINGIVARDALQLIAKSDVALFGDDLAQTLMARHGISRALATGVIWNLVEADRLSYSTDAKVSLVR